MGSSPVIVGGGSGAGAGRCCDMSLKCWCRWRWDHCFLSTPFLFFLSSFLLLGLVASLFAWFTFSPYDRSPLSSLGCQVDSEGSWSIGIFYGHSPFALSPIELKNVGVDKGAAWPVANPVVTCATASVAGYPSNFVADPFLFVDSLVLLPTDGHDLPLFILITSTIGPEAIKQKSFHLPSAPLL